MREVFAPPRRPPARWALQLAVAWLALCFLGLGFEMMRVPALRALFPSGVALAQRGAGVAAEQPTSRAVPAQQQRCAIYNGARFHSDVAAGLAWAFQEAGCNVTMYVRHVAHNSVRVRGALGHTRAPSRAVVSPWYRGAVCNSTDMLAEASQLDMIVMVTFPEPDFTTQAQLLRSRHSLLPHQRLLLVTHNQHRLLSGCTAATHPWLLDVLAEQAVEWAPHLEQHQQHGQQQKQPPRIQLLALAPCVSTFTSAMLAAWAAGRNKLQGKPSSASGSSVGPLPRAEVPWIAPLVPWAPKAAGTTSSHGSKGVPAGRARHICIQGSIDPKRRDYAGAFAAASHPAVLAQLRARNESLLLVGSDTGAELDVPAALRPFVRIVANSSFDDYYATLSSCRAILTAFPSDVYITYKASSMPAALLQVGTPLLTEDSVLAGYSYLSPAASYTYRRPAASRPPDPARCRRICRHAGSRTHKAAVAGVSCRLQRGGGRCRRGAGGAAPAGNECGSSQQQCQQQRWCPGRCWCRRQCARDAAAWRMRPPCWLRLMMTPTRQRTQRLGG
ncbi:hypothetical protein ABPG75_008493 [Micractinium tetrahymenae]